LPLHGGQSGIGAAALGGFLDRGVDLAKPAIQVGSKLEADEKAGTPKR
jgi:hypothetical protein